MGVLEEIGYDSWTAIFISFGFWSFLYFIIQTILRQRSPEYCSRVLALFHGTIMTFLGLNQCFTGKSLFDNPEEKTTLEQSFILVVSLGYFMEDLIWCLYYRTETTLMLAHHIYSCFALSRMLMTGVNGHAATCGLGALEVTNPLLQTRWFVRSHGYHNTALFTSVEITFIIMFFVMRILLGSVFLIVIVMQPKNSWEFRFLTTLIYIMSWMFMVNILQYFNNKYLKENIEVELGHINTS